MAFVGDSSMHFRNFLKGIVKLFFISYSFFAFLFAQPPQITNRPLYIYLFGHMPLKASNQSIPPSREQIQNLFDIFRTVGKVNEFNIKTSFERWTTITNINKNLLVLDDESKKGFHLFYFYLYLEKRGKTDEIDVFLADRKWSLKEMLNDLHWGNLTKVIWINNANPVFFEEYFSNTFFILDFPFKLTSNLSNVFATGGGALNLDTGKNFLTLREVMNKINHFPNVKSNDDLLDISLITYEWIPETVITNLVKIPQYKFITNFFSNRYLTRNYLFFKVNNEKEIIKLKEADRLEYKIEKKSGYWK